LQMRCRLEKRHRPRMIKIPATMAKIGTRIAKPPRLILRSCMAPKIISQIPNNSMPRLLGTLMMRTPESIRLMVLGIVVDRVGLWMSKKDAGRGNHGQLTETCI